MKNFRRQRWRGSVKILASTMVVTLCASCSSGQRVSLTPAPECASHTEFLVSGLNESTQIAFQSDGLKIGALLTKPRGAGPFPAYIHNHGAMTREQASGPLWTRTGELDARLVGAGYVVLRPARRGYLGSQGNTTTYWVQGSKLGVADVIAGAYDEARDVKSAIDYLSGCAFVDRRRIAVGGQSVGGLVTVIAAAKQTDLAAVVSINGGITWTQNGVQQGFPAVSAVWRAEAEHINAPVLLLHGCDDLVVTPDLSRELAELLQRRAAVVTLKLYDGGHDVFPIDEIVKFLDGSLKLR